jgi:hypothetical protein
MIDEAIDNKEQKQKQRQHQYEKKREEKRSARMLYHLRHTKARSCCLACASRMTTATPRQGAAMLCCAMLYPAYSNICQRHGTCGVTRSAARAC